MRLFPYRKVSPAPGDSQSDSVLTESFMWTRLKFSYSGNNSNAELATDLEKVMSAACVVPTK